MRSIWKMAAVGLALVLMVLIPGFAQADDAPDCSTAETQSDMTSCSQQQFEAADAALNAQYRKTRAAMQATDADIEADARGAEKALLAGQRGWIAYRDGECEAEGFQARGGSMEPMLVSSCKATMTRLRTKELKALADGPAN